MADIKIKVGLDGAQQAAAGLKQVDAAVDAVGQSGQQAAAGVKAEGTAAQQAAQQNEAATKSARDLANQQERVEDTSNRAGRGARLAGDGIFEFHRKGEVAVKNMLALFNPALAQSADFFFDLAEGASRMSTALLAVGAGGAVIGGLVMAFQAMADSAKRTAEELKRVGEEQSKLRDEGVDLRAGLSKDLAGLGVEPRAGVLNQIIEKMAALNLTGVREDLARNAAVAQVVGGLDDEQTDQFLRGIAISGRKPIEFSGDQAGNRRMIGTAMRRGATPEAASMFDSIREAEKQAALRDAYSIGSRNPDAAATSIDTLMQRLRLDRPDLNDQAREFIEKMLRQNVDTKQLGPLMEAINKTRWFDVQTQQLRDAPQVEAAGDVRDLYTNREKFEADKRAAMLRELRTRTVGTTGKTAGELIDVIDEFRAKGAGAMIDPSIQPTTQPVEPRNVQVINNDNRTIINNAATYLQGFAGGRASGIELIPGGNQ